MVPDLATLRASIDRLDATVASVLVKRARLAQRVALRKRLTNEASRDERREIEVRDHYASRLGPIGWSEESVDTLLATMLHASRDLQTRLRIAVQGGPGCWSEISCRANVPDVEILHCETVRDVEEACQSGTAVAAWLARHNSTVGSISETDEATADMDAWLRVPYPVRHALVGPRGLRPEMVEVVRAHPRAIDQCRRTLTRDLPNARLEGAVDGAHAARSLVDGEAAAVLGPAGLAEPRLAVLRPCMNDEESNTTTFELLVRREAF
ncbi:MAG: chorismate mutase [Euryarchaeota archaeon]|nr:chorismate mutase [Euryarchaeota archaeon]